VGRHHDDDQALSGEHLPATRPEPGTPAAHGGGGEVPVIAYQPRAGERPRNGGRVTRLLVMALLLMMAVTATAVIVAVRAASPGTRALVVVTATPASPTPTASATPSPTPSADPSPSPRLGATPSPAPSAGATPAPVGGAVPTAPAGPSTTVDLGNGVTMRIDQFFPGSTIDFRIDNRGNNAFILDFDASDITVFDDGGHVYPVTGVAGNHETIYAGQQISGTTVNVRGAPTSVARSWTVNFKAISGRRDITIVYTFA
jgi:hypothetical protein